MEIINQKNIMKTKDYIVIFILVGIVIIGIFLKGFPGGFICGAGSVLLITVTLGKIVFMKSQKRIDAAMRIKKMMQD